MATDIVMPQMGESIAEGTITKWLKKVGDHVDRDEPLFEISTDKVDAEIPSPAAGVLTEIKFGEGETVEVNKVVAVLDGGSASSAAPAQPSAAIEESAKPEPQTEPESTKDEPERVEAVATPSSSEAEPAVEEPPAEAPASEAVAHDEATPAEEPEAATEPEASAAAEPPATTLQPESKSQTPSPPASGNGGRVPTAEDLRKSKSSPLVRKIASEHGIDIAKLEGTGLSGRVTKDDILSFIQSKPALKPTAPAAKPSRAPQLTTSRPQPASNEPARPSAPPAQPTGQPAAPQTLKPATGDRVEQMSPMRKKIAEHMVQSRRTSAHVTTVYEIDMTKIAKLRDEHNESFLDRAGTKLTYMPFIFQAVTNAIRKFPIFNAQVSGDQIIYKRDVNLGMAVALDWGLIVPVIKRADDLSISGLARAANDLAERARAKQLKPDEVGGGTFTITNPGVFGGLFGTPIINQPQLAILGVGKIEKRPKVLTTPEGEDYIAVRWQSYFALSFDHRVIDGADAERFLAYVKQQLEEGDFSL